MYGLSQISDFAARRIVQLMFVSMMRIRPVGMNMMFFPVLVFVNMRLMNDSSGVREHDEYRCDCANAHESPLDASGGANAFPRSSAKDRRS